MSYKLLVSLSEPQISTPKDWPEGQTDFPRMQQAATQAQAFRNVGVVEMHGAIFEGLLLNLYEEQLSMTEQLTKLMSWVR